MGLEHVRLLSPCPCPCGGIDIVRRMLMAAYISCNLHVNNEFRGGNMVWSKWVSTVERSTRMAVAVSEPFSKWVKWFVPTPFETTVCRPCVTYATFWIYTWIFKSCWNIFSRFLFLWNLLTWKLKSIYINVLLNWKSRDGFWSNACVWCYDADTIQPWVHRF